MVITVARWASPDPPAHTPVTKDEGFLLIFCGFHAATGNKAVLYSDEEAFYLLEGTNARALVRVSSAEVISLLPDGQKVFGEGTDAELRYSKGTPTLRGRKMTTPDHHGWRVQPNGDETFRVRIP